MNKDEAIFWVLLFWILIICSIGLLIADRISKLRKRDEDD